MVQKLENIQALRGVAVIMVVLFHLMTIEQKYGGDSILPGIMSVGLGGVDLFFVISGFVMTTILQGKFGKLLALQSFVWT